MNQKGLKNELQNCQGKRRRRMPKAFNERMKQLKNIKAVFKTCPNEWEQLWEQNCELINIEMKKKKIAKKPYINYVQSLTYRVPGNLVFTLYGMITINEQALKLQLKDQSFITSVFNFYNLMQVQTNPNYLSLTIQKSKDNSYPIAYFIQRFRNFGDSYFYQLANKIQNMHNIISQMESLPSAPINITEQEVSNYMERLKGKAYLLKIQPGKLYFSKELIEISGCSISEIANQCLAFKSFVSDFFNVDNYREQTDRFFEIFDLRMKLSKGEIDVQTYVEGLVQKNVEYITNKDEGVVKVLTNKYNLAPGISCWEIEQIIGKEELSHQKHRNQLKSKHSFLEDKKWSQFQKIDKLIPIPENHKKGNEVKVCYYRQANSPS